MTRARSSLLFPLLALAIFLADCGGAATAKKEDGKRYEMKGQIMAIDPATKTATIAHGQIGDWMGPMAMEYSVQPDAEFQKLHVGDKIEATVVVVSDVKYYVTDVKVAPK